MVPQRARETRIWGKGTDGAEVSAVGEPVAVRYAWRNDPMVNLFGRNGLPVGPFRTDSFDLINTDNEE